MLLSQAFRLLEDGEILTDGHLFFKLSDEGLMYAFAVTADWGMSRGGIGQYTFENFLVYEKPKEKVQYYKAFYREANCEKNDESSPDFTSKEHFLETVGMIESDFDFIQMIKVGDPI